MTNFWQKLDKPFTVLAPMDDVTDDVFRQVVTISARPDVFFTEFTNVDGLVHGGYGAPFRKLKYKKEQHPIVAQIWGTSPANMQKAAVIIRELGFDGIDINMGCPVRDVVKKGSGAGLIGNFEATSSIIKVVKKGAGGLPVSVKTRLGITKNTAEEWCTFLLKQKIAALTVHARTAKQMSKGEADWNEIGKTATLRDKIDPETIIIGNGDIKNYSEVLQMHRKYKVDGVMIGRGIFLNPWVFEKKTNAKAHTKKELLTLLVKHIALFEKTWADTKNFASIKKFLKMYIKDFDGAGKIRIKLMQASSLAEMKLILTKQ